MKTKRKAKLNWLSLTGLASFFLHEYQHVHLLRFKKQSFTLVGKPNPPLCYIRYTQLHARADAVCINQTLPMKRSCWRAFVRAKPGSTEAHLFTWSMKSDFCYNLPWSSILFGPGSGAHTVWSRRFGAAQTMHSHKCEHVEFFTRTLKKKWSQMRPFCLQSKALFREDAPFSATKKKYFWN